MTAQATEVQENWLPSSDELERLRPLIPDVGNRFMLLIEKEQDARHAFAIYALRSQRRLQWGHLVVSLLLPMAVLAAGLLVIFKADLKALGGVLVAAAVFVLAMQAIAATIRARAGSAQSKGDEE